MTIIPLAMLFGPWAWALRWGLVALLAATIVKCVAFAAMRQSARAMLVASAITAVPGVLAGLTYVFPLVGIGGIAIAIVLSWLATHRLLYAIAGGVAYAVSTVLFVGAQILVSHASDVAFWASKYGCVTGALLLSLWLTTQWETRIAGQGLTTQVFRANAIALLLLAIVVTVSRVA
jgi:hypothetical protein